MIELGHCLTPLIPLAYPPAPIAGNVHVVVGDLIKVTSAGLIGVVTAISREMINFKYVQPGRRHVTAEGRTIQAWNAGWKSEYNLHFADKREFYLGPTPGVFSDVGDQVRSRMAREEKYRPNNGGEILYKRDSEGRPLPAGSPGRWVSIRHCDMGHIVDAVSWWNSNGRLTGPRSPEVHQFMNDPDNYEFEPSAENRRRGARIGAQYLPPV
jgi:hypothetical protein